MFIGTSYSTITPEEQKGFIAYLAKEEKALRNAIARDEKKKSDSKEKKKHPKQG